MVLDFKTAMNTNSQPSASSLINHTRSI